YPNWHWTRSGVAPSHSETRVRYAFGGIGRGWSRPLSCARPDPGRRDKGRRMAQVRPFGKLDDGRAVHAHALDGGGPLRAEVLDLGGILARLWFEGPGGPVPLVLGLADARAYFADPSYLGIVVGRFGNRIGGAAFALDGRTHHLSANDGRNHLHGGMLGLDRKSVV